MKTDIAALNIFIISGSCFLMALISFIMELKLAKTIILATIRAALQLFLVGKLLHLLFLYDHHLLNITIAILMTFVAIHTIYSRLTNKNKLTLLSLFPSLCLSAWPITFFLIFLVKGKVELSASVFIPLIGLILGNSLNGITIGIQRVQDEIETKSDQVTTYLGLGLDWFSATKPILISALSTSMTPILNSMLIVGLVSFPGMMTGQILAGENPLQSALYQFILLCCIFLTLFVGSLLGIYFQLRMQFIDGLYFQRINKQ